MNQEPAPILDSVKPTYEALEEELILLRKQVDDLTNKNEDLKAQCTLYQNVINTVPAFIFWKDLNNNVMGFNEAFLKAMNIPAEKLLAKSSALLFKNVEQFWQDDKEVIETRQPKLNIIRELTILPDKSMWLKIDKAPLINKEGNITGIIAVAIDITEIKANQDQLEKALAENEEMNRALEVAKKRAEEANRIKSEFLTNMSHELRTPLNAILGFSEALLNKIKDQTALSYIHTIHSSGKVLLTLVNDLLDLSKIEAGKLILNIEPVDLRRLLDEVRQMFMPALEKSGVSLIISLPPDLPDTFWLDEIRLRQVLVNLVGNAVKFTSQGHITLSVAIEKKNPDTSQCDLILNVTDTGIGLKEQDLKIIFDKFRQASNLNSRYYDGTGLGLTITMRLVKLMKGNIKASSMPGRGSSFEVILPGILFSDTKVKIPETNNLANIRFLAPTLLVVDDIKSNIEVVRTFVEDYDIRLLEAYNGQEALNLISERKPDLILMDLRMPLMDGYETIRELRKQEETKSIPVVAFTASVMKTDEEAIRNEFDGVLLKPFSKAELFKVLMAYLPYRLEPKTVTETVAHNAPEEPTLTTKKERLARAQVNLQAFASQAATLAEILDLDALGNFIDQLKIFMEEEQLQFLLQDYTQTLSAAYQGYEIENLTKQLHAFPKLI